MRTFAICLTILAAVGAAFILVPDGDDDGYNVLFDCAENDPHVSPAQRESCDGIDNDCDGQVDEEFEQEETTYFADRDGDGFGSDWDVETGTACKGLRPPREGFATNRDDCDDVRPDVNPNSTFAELCSRDMNCDGHLGVNRDGDRLWSCDDPDDSDERIDGEEGLSSEGFPSGRCSDGIDNDGDGLVDKEDYFCTDIDGDRFISEDACPDIFGVDEPDYLCVGDCPPSLDGCPRSVHDPGAWKQGYGRNDRDRDRVPNLFDACPDMYGNREILWNDAPIFRADIRKKRFGCPLPRTQPKATEP